MKLSRLIILSIAAYGGYLYYNRYHATMNVVSGSGSGSAPVSRSSGGMQLSSDGIGTIGGIGTVGQNSVSTSSGSKNILASMTSVDLLKAAAEGNLNAVKDLLEDRVDPNSRDSHRRTPLIYAAWNGHDEISTKLLAAGANIQFQDRSGFNALDYAAGRGRTETVAFLLSLTNEKDTRDYVKFATIMNAVLTNNIELLPAPGTKMKYINRVTPEDLSPLHISASSGYLPMVKALVERGAKVNLVNSHDQTPLHWAAWNNHTEVMAYLLDQGARISVKDDAGSTPMLMAVSNNSVDAVKLLLARGAKKNPANKQGQTALMIANDRQYTEILRLLSD